MLCWILMSAVCEKDIQERAVWRWLTGNALIKTPHQWRLGSRQHSVEICSADVWHCSVLSSRGVVQWCKMFKNLQWLRRPACTQQTWVQLTVASTWVIGDNRKDIQPKLLPCPSKSLMLVGKPKPLIKGTGNVKYPMKNQILSSYAKLLFSVYFWSSYYLQVHVEFGNTKGANLIEL